MRRKHVGSVTLSTSERDHIHSWPTLHPISGNTSQSICLTLLTNKQLRVPVHDLQPASFLHVFIMHVYFWQLNLIISWHSFTLPLYLKSHSIPWFVTLSNLFIRWGRNPMNYRAEKNLIKMLLVTSYTSINYKEWKCILLCNLPLWSS